MSGLLLTGVTGFVGRNLLLAEAALGTRLFVPVRDPEKLRRQLQEEGLDPTVAIPLPVDPSSWPRLEIERAILCAGVLFARSREEYFNTNVEWTSRVLEALPHSCDTVVLSSQAAGGPTPAGVTARAEHHPDTPVTWYGRSKLALEERLRERFPSRNIKILRPPMVLGARDTATLPLFKMAASLVRVKPGFRPKEYSFIAVEDLVAGIRAASKAPPTPLYISAARTITDSELIKTAAQSVGGRGITMPVPQVLVKFLSLIVDAVPSLRASTPSLTRDRARDIWPDRWVVDSTAFRKATGWTCRLELPHAIESARDSYARQGALRHTAPRSEKT